MRVIIHDLDPAAAEKLESGFDQVVRADGRYAPCQGCFGCWTKHPAECFMKDSLSQVCRVIGQADELVVVTRNLYGSYSADIKNVMDRAIGTSTPFSTYRDRQMHHTLRYGRRNRLRVIVYGDMTEAEKSTLQLMVERNAVNMGFREHSIVFCADAEQAGGMA